MRADPPLKAAFTITTQKREMLRKSDLFASSKQAILYILGAALAPTRDPSKVRT